MRADVEYIDPAYAAQALEQNAGNRSISWMTVNKYAKMMREDKWLPTGESVKFTADGRLLDGQHRFHAIIAAQRPIAMLVVRGVPEESFAVLDTGKARNLSDVLSIEGYKHTHSTAGIARGAYAYASGLSFGTGFDIPTMEGFIKAHPRISELAALVDNTVRKSFPKSSLGAVTLLGTEGGNFAEEAQKFIDGMATGAGLWRGDPRLTLREWYLSHKGTRVNLNSAALFSAAARAWSAFAEGRELLKISKASASPTLDNTAIVGFDRAAFVDVPDLREEAVRKWTSNLPKRDATPPLDLPRSPP